MKKYSKRKEYPVLSTVANELGFGYETVDNVQHVIIGEGQWIKDDQNIYDLTIEFRPQPVGYMMVFCATNKELDKEILVDYDEFSALARQVNVYLGDLLYDKNKCYSFFTALKLIQPDVDRWRIRTFVEKQNKEIENLLAKL